MENRENKQSPTSQTTSGSGGQKTSYIFFSVTFIIITLITGAFYIYSLRSIKSEKVVVDNSPTSAETEVSSSGSDTSGGSCSFTGALGKIEYTRLSDIVSKEYCSEKYESWDTVQNEPFTFQVKIPPYYTFSQVQGPLFEIDHPVYGEYNLGGWNDDQGRKLGDGWSAHEQLLCESASIGHIKGNISAFDFFRSTHHYMVSRDGQAIYIMNPDDGRFWAKHITYQGDSSESKHVRAFKQKALVTDPDFLCFLDSFSFIYTAPEP